jgi:hypothetical protein
MKQFIPLVITVAILAVAHGDLKAQLANSRDYSKSEIKQMILDARTTQQYEEIAAYYRSRQQSFKQQARSEKLEWIRREQNVSSLAEKYPRPVDSSRYRYEYFAYEAQQMAVQAERFEGLAAKNQ